MSQSPSLNFGPSWMRPTTTRGASQDNSVSSTLKNTKSWDSQDQLQQSIPNTFEDSNLQQQQQLDSNFATQPEKSFNSRVYTIEELLSVWQEIQGKISNGESVDSYRTLEPIQALVDQIDRDRSFQGHLKKDDPQSTEINEKVNEFKRWAKNEPLSAVNNNVSKLTDDLSTASPFANTSSLLVNDQSFNSPYGTDVSSNFTQPPLTLLQPQQIRWYYLDPAGNQQGPFDGVMMHSWYASNYLTLDLNLKREGEYSFYPLQQFVTIVNNYTEPFLLPLPDLSPKPVQFQQSLGFDQQLPNLFNQSLSLQQPQAQSNFAHLQDNQQSWIGSTSGRSSPWVNQSTNLASDPVNAQDFRIGTQSPFVNSAFTTQNNTTSLANVETAGPTQDDEILNNIHNKVLDNVLKEDDKPSVKAEEPKAKTETAPVEKPVVATKPQKAEPKTAPNPKATPSKSKQSQQVTSSQTNGESTADSSKVLKTEPAAKPTAPKLAPWANKSVSNAPQLTLEQIQRLEAEESAKQSKAKSKQDKLLAAQLLANTEKSIKEAEASKTILPSTSSWGTPSKTASAPAKTLLDIQREEEEAAAAAALAAATAANSSVSSDFTGASSLSSIPLKKASSSKNSFASIATSSVPSTNAWTTVTSRKPVAKPQPPKITSGPKPITPEILRSVSTTTASQIQPSSQYVKTVSPRQDFLTWCRTSMKLNKGINKDEVLQVILTLPVGIESAEIVADTIYSNSSTMDGRRFAQEFMKRRKSIEDQAQDGLSWNEALRMSASNDEDGWDFQVVGKKKKGKN